MMEFEGFVDRFDGDVAHITLKNSIGEKFYVECPSAKLKTAGVREHRRFKCWSKRWNVDHVDLVIKMIPDVEVSEETERQIDEWLEECLGTQDV